jgi:toll-like receptor 13
MSNQFAESEWCQWEIDLVQERMRRQGKKALVLIMYRQIDSRHMTSPLRTLLGTTPHLSYKEGIGETLFWKTVIRDVRNLKNESSQTRQFCLNQSWCPYMEHANQILSQ